MLMAKSISVKRKKPGRPATGTEPLYGVRIGDHVRHTGGPLRGFAEITEGVCTYPGRPAGTTPAASAAFRRVNAASR